MADNKNDNLADALAALSRGEIQDDQPENDEQHEHDDVPLDPADQQAQQQPAAQSHQIPSEPAPARSPARPATPTQPPAAAKTAQPPSAPAKPAQPPAAAARPMRPATPARPASPIDSASPPAAPQRPATPLSAAPPPPPQAEPDSAPQQTLDPVAEASTEALEAGYVVDDVEPGAADQTNGDDEVIAPPPPMEYLAHTTPHAHQTAQRLEQTVKSLRFQRTIIPLLLTNGGLMLLMAISAMFLVPSHSPFYRLRTDSPGLLYAMLVLGVVLLGMAAATMLYVRQRLLNAQNDSHGDPAR